MQLVLNITTPSPLMNASDFLAQCTAAGGPAPGHFITYNASDVAQQKLVPNIVTMAAVLDAVPVDVASQAAVLPAGVTPVFDAVAQFGGFSPMQATQYVYDHHINETAGLSKVRAQMERGDLCVCGVRKKVHDAQHCIAAGSVLSRSGHQAHY
jgi:hypothetical protein